MSKLKDNFGRQTFANGYELIDGVAMHAEHGDRFQIPHDVLKKHVAVGHFIELRTDSPRFSAHPDAPASCTCPLCNEEATNPILIHEQPASLLKLPKQDVPSRGWGEEFWVQVTQRDADYFQAVVDNPLYESRLHNLHEGDTLFFHADHILAVHGSHRQDIVLGMDAADLKQLAQWLTRHP